MRPQDKIMCPFVKISGCTTRAPIMERGLEKVLTIYRRDTRPFPKIIPYLGIIVLILAALFIATKYQWEISTAVNRVLLTILEDNKGDESAKVNMHGGANLHKPQNSPEKVNFAQVEIVAKSAVAYKYWSVGELGRDIVCSLPEEEIYYYMLTISKGENSKKKNTSVNSAQFIKALYLPLAYFRDSQSFQSLQLPDLQLKLYGVIATPSKKSGFSSNSAIDLYLLGRLNISLDSPESSSMKSPIEAAGYCISGNLTRYSAAAQSKERAGLGQVVLGLFPAASSGSQRCRWELPEFSQLPITLSIEIATGSKISQKEVLCIAGKAVIEIA